MSTHVNDTATESTVNPAAQLDVLGDECARTILVAASEGPRTAKELTERTDCSSATIYRRINNLLESELLAECIRFEPDGTHTTAYESTVDRVQVEIGETGITVSTGPGHDTETEPSVQARRGGNR
ncbi:helix-turn-helix domain-containing protein [Natronosalvus caseinilyticus]|uniref:helix-turn-helix domain-containing protein n=1 Tax=Natronosalvus caseinilyticus TaxID=2953747 RepID=UPI0028AB4DDD|nr:helix-turn-helix domain-containing protein [Natronosalvus caseinilyticus]